MELIELENYYDGIFVASVVEPEPDFLAGAGLFSWSRSRWKSAGSGLLLFGLGVLRWQSSDILTCKI